MSIVSIIIPVYNAEPYIRECLDSILNQTLTDIEVIAVDDCGADNSMSIVDEYAKKDNRVRIIRQEKNMGPMIARENGYKESTSNYFFFCDSDDTLPPDALELLYNEAIATNADITIGNMIYIGLNGEQKVWKKEVLSYGSDKIAVYKSLFNGEISHNLCAKLFKAKLFDYAYVSIPNMRNGEDAMLFYQLVENTSKVACINNPVYNYIQHETSSTHIRISSENIEKLILWRCFSYNKIVKKYPEIEICGTKATIRVLTNIWASSPNYSRKKFIKVLESNKIINLFSVGNMKKYMNYKDMVFCYYQIFISYTYNKIKSLIIS